MRTIFLMAVLAACGGSGDDPHEVVTCKGWQAGGRCEIACQSAPPDGIAIDTNGDGIDDTCRIRGAAAPNCPARMLATFGDERGCCGQTDIDGQTVMAWFECE